MRLLLLRILSFFLRPLARRVPFKYWPYLFGRVFDIKIPGRVRPNKAPTTYGSANINIVLTLLDRAKRLEGSVGECGVFRGSTLVPLAHHLLGLDKKIYGLDSFAGFDASELQAETSGSSPEMLREVNEFAATNINTVTKKLKLLGAEKNVILLRGFFKDTLSKIADEKFCFVHLDCDLAEAYDTCLNFFYPRMVKGGILLFDEYNDPVYVGATRVIDNFFSSLPEKPKEIVQDNYIKYYIVKS